MQIRDNITSFASDLTRKAGRAILDESKRGSKLSNGLRKVNDFVQGESYNPGRKAYYTLMGAFVIAPRLLQAREPDEFREILTRDVVTVLTILFAMKGLKSGMCTAAQKNAGFALVKDTVGQNAGKLKRLVGYLNPEGGITALDSKEILTRYSRIYDKDTFVKTLDMVDKEGGDIVKMFNIEKQEGLLSKIKKHIPFFQNRESATPLYDAAKKMFGEGFEQKSNSELIDIVKNITKDSGEALEGLEDIIGAKALGNVPDALQETGRKAKEGILNGSKNPITNYARNIAANFENISLALTAGFLGFGLPKLNEKLTADKHLNKPGLNMKRSVQPDGGCEAPHVLYSSLKRNEKEMKTFQSFMGNA